MWQRFTLYDWRVIAHYLGVLVSCFSLALLLPFVTAIFLAEWGPAFRYLLAMGVSLTLGSLLSLARVEPGRLNHQQALAVTGFSWIVLAFVASVPLALSGHYGCYTDALFEGVSGLTTTGASLVVDLEHMSYADNMWRFVMHLIGGLGLIVVALSLGLLGRASSSLYSSEGRSEHVLPNIVNTARLISKISLVVIVVALAILMCLCLLAGLEPIRAFLNALWISITGFITGGFAPTSQSIMYYHSYPIEVVCMLLMLLGMTNFALFVRMWFGDTQAFFKDLEIRTGLLWILLAATVFLASLCAGGAFDDLIALLRRGIFMVVSAASTTGLQVVTNNQMTTVFSSGAFLVIALMMAVGGSGGSTAGGMKFSRLGLIAKSLVSSVKETLSPNNAHVSVTYFHLGKQVLNTEVAREALSISALFVITYLFGALAGIAYGYDATSAIFESIAMASNGGLSSGIISQGMPLGLEIIYLIEMWIGRLEFITLIALVVKIVVSCAPKKKAKSE